MTSLLSECSPDWLKAASSNPDLRQLLQPKPSKYRIHQPTAKQLLALVAGNFLPDDEPSEIFYGGAAGGGKSDWLLDGALEHAEVPGYAAIILRRTFADLDQPGAVMSRARDWLAGSDARFNEQKKRWRFPSGASLSFGYLRRDSDVYQYQGAEFQYVGFDELTQFSEFQYTYLFSRCRRPDDQEILRELELLEEDDRRWRELLGKLQLARVPLRVRAASNPGGIGHGWVKKRFPIDGKPRGRRVFIPAKLNDNPHLDRETYVKTLKHLPEVTREQLLNGDWGAFEGMAYPEYSRELHVIEPLELPNGWLRLESMDHGVTNPTAWLLIVTDYDGNEIVADEYYERGLPEVHAPAILDRRSQWWEAKDEDGYQLRHPAYGDPSSLRESLPIQNEQGQPLSLQEHYQHLGVRLIPGNNRRKIGMIEIRSRLTPDATRRFPAWHPRAGELGCPRMFFVGDHCPELLEQIENAPLAIEETDPERGEAVDRRWESAHGHAHAALRYGLTARPRSAEEPTDEPDDPREAYMKARAERRRRGVKNPDSNDYVEL